MLSQNYEKSTAGSLVLLKVGKSSERPKSNKAQRSVIKTSDAEIDQKQVTKKEYRTWANDPGILRTGGKQYTIPKETPFLRIVEKCPFGQGYAEITFSEEIFRSFYPYELLPSKLAVVIPHCHLNITPRKGSWKGEFSR
jgi:hypothetical protein